MLTREYYCYWNLDHENCKSLVGNLLINHTNNVIDFVETAIWKFEGNKLLTLGRWGTMYKGCSFIPQPQRNFEQK